MRIIGAVLFALLSLSQAALAASHGNPHIYSSSPIGINLNAQAFSGNPQIPWLNLMKSGGDWITASNASVCNGSDTNEEALLYASFLDANGYPNISLAGGPAHTFTKICTVLNFGLAGPTIYYPAGNYTLTLGCSTGPCGGAGNSVAIGGDATATCSDTCNFNVTPSPSGIQIAITAVNSGNYVNSISVVLTSKLSIVATGDCTAAIALGKTCFDPAFKTAMAPFNPIRFMQATATITSAQVNWSDRGTTSYVFWNRGVGFNSPGTPIGWPWEVVIGFCNELHTDCWINEPCISNAGYVSSMAALFSSLLDPSLKVYVERCNEDWNDGAFPAGLHATMSANGLALFPGSPNTSDQARIYEIATSIDDFPVWKTAFGSNSAKVIRVFGGWAGNDGYNQFYLPITAPYEGGGTWTGTVASHFDAMATAPYYSISVPSSYTGDVDGGLSRFFCVTTDGLISPGCTGVMPTGAGAHTTTGTSTAYVLSDGAGTGCPAAVTTNGYVTTAIFHTPNGESPTIAVDGCSALPLLCDGNPASFNTLACGYGAGIGSVVPGGTFTGSISGLNLTITAIGSGTLPFNGGPIGGSGVTAGTFIVGCPGNVCGGTGVYTVSIPQTVSAGTLFTESGIQTSSGPYLLAYTTTTSAGTVTTSWRIVCGPGVDCMNSSIGQAVGYITTNLATAASPSFGNGLQVILYEGGWGSEANSNSPSDPWNLLYGTAATDPRAYQANTLLMESLRATGLVGPFVYFVGLGTGGVGSFMGVNWELIDNQYQPILLPKYESTLDFIRRNPCWWTINGIPCRN